MLQKILIANRGEIACRIIKTAKEMGIQTVAVYSNADKDNLHVSLADYAFCIGNPQAIDSYLNIDIIIDIAKKSNVDAIHPGYGFLSENSLFAEKCIQNKIIFIGPSIAAMKAMASKQLAKQQLEKTKVPLTPGYHGADQSDETLLNEAKKIGFPVLLKAANGGGGKGMRAVYSCDDFLTHLKSAQREAQASFASETMIIEKLITKPRHIEIQILADNHGNVIHLFERDCSIQRRHQKIIEEAPASNISPKLKNNIANAAVEVAKTIEYRGAGTVEFLVEDDKFYFMEMNTRLQVEHPVTEMITGIDLVKWQLLIADDAVLTIQQKDLKCNGHAIECRVYAEDPENNFMPSIGQITYLQENIQPNIRIDSGITTNSYISRYYDPMLSKVIAWGENREQARRKLIDALNNYYIAGIKSNLTFLKTILHHQAFIENNITTGFLDKEKLEIAKPNFLLCAYLTAAIDYLMAQNTDPILADNFAYQMHLTSHWIKQYSIQGQLITVKIIPKKHNEVILSALDSDPENSINAKIKLEPANNLLFFDNGSQLQKFLFQKTAKKTILFTQQGNVTVEPHQPNATLDDASHSENHLNAPMPGTIVAILKKANDIIKKGEPLIIIEAMKMEHTIVAPSNGVINSIFYDIGSQVQEGATLVDMERK